MFLIRKQRNFNETNFFKWFWSHPIWPPVAILKIDFFHVHQDKYFPLVMWNILGKVNNRTIRSFDGVKCLLAPPAHVCK